MMISSSLIKLDDELMMEIGENGRLWKRTSKRFHRIIEFDFDFAEKLKIEGGRDFRNLKL